MNFIIKNMCIWVLKVYVIFKQHINIFKLSYKLLLQKTEIEIKLIIINILF